MKFSQTRDLSYEIVWKYKKKSVICWVLNDWKAIFSPIFFVHEATCINQCMLALYHVDYYISNVL